MQRCKTTVFVAVAACALLLAACDNDTEPESVADDSNGSEDTTDLSSLVDNDDGSDTTDTGIEHDPLERDFGEAGNEVAGDYLDFMEFRHQALTEGEFDADDAERHLMQAAIAGLDNEVGEVIAVGEYHGRTQSSILDVDVDDGNATLLDCRFDAAEAVPTDEDAPDWIGDDQWRTHVVDLHESEHGWVVTDSEMVPDGEDQHSCIPAHRQREIADWLETNWWPAQYESTLDLDPEPVEAHATDEVFPGWERQVEGAAEAGWSYESEGDGDPEFEAYVSDFGVASEKDGRFQPEVCTVQRGDGLIGENNDGEEATFLGRDHFEKFEQAFDRAADGDYVVSYIEFLDAGQDPDGCDDLA